MQTVLIDTDIAIDYLRGNKNARDLIFQLLDSGRAYLSILSVYELHAGMKDKEKDHTVSFIDACNIEPLSMEIAQKAGELYRKNRKQGITLTAIDCLINATAVLKNHKIATNNKGHYPNRDILYPF